MGKCECIIGLWQGKYNITLKELKKEIKQENEYLTYVKKEIPGLLKHLGKSEKKDLKYYTDGRRSTNLDRYNYCPICGQKINWKEIREEENG